MQYLDNYLGNKQLRKSSEIERLKNEKMDREIERDTTRTRKDRRMKDFGLGK